MSKTMKKFLATIMAVIMTASVMTFGNAPLVMASEAGAVNIAYLPGVFTDATLGEGGLVSDGSALTGDTFMFQLKGGINTIDAAGEAAYFKSMSLFVPVYNGFAANSFGVQSGSVNLAGVTKGVTPPAEAAARFLDELGDAGFGPEEAANYTWYEYEVVCNPKLDGGQTPEFFYPGSNFDFRFDAKYANGITANGTKAVFWGYLKGEGAGNDKASVPVYGPLGSAATVTAVAQTEYGIKKEVSPVAKDASDTAADYGSKNKHLGVPASLKTRLGSAVTWSDEYQYVTYRITLDQLQNLAGGTLVAADRFGMVALKSPSDISITDTVVMDAWTWEQFQLDNSNVQLVAVVDANKTGSSGIYTGITLGADGKFTIDHTMISMIDGKYVLRNEFDVVVAYKKTAYATADSFFGAEGMSGQYELDGSGRYYMVSDANGSDKYTVDGEASLAYTLWFGGVGAAKAAAQAKFAFSGKKPDVLSIKVTKKLATAVYNGTASPTLTDIVYNGEAQKLFPPKAGGLEFGLVGKVDGGVTDILKDKDGNLLRGTLNDKGEIVFSNIVDVPGGKYWIIEIGGVQGFNVAANTEVVITNKNGENAATVVNPRSTSEGLLLFQKVDSYSKALLHGAEFEVKDKDNKVVAMITEKNDFYSAVLPEGTYTLEEKTAPAGYAKIAPMTFEIKNGVITFLSTKLAGGVVVPGESAYATNLAGALVYNFSTGNGVLLLQKYMKDADGQEKDMTQTELNNVKFTVYNASADKLSGTIKNAWQSPVEQTVIPTGADLAVALEDIKGMPVKSNVTPFMGTNSPVLPAGYYWIVETTSGTVATNYIKAQPQLVYVRSLAETNNTASVGKFVNVSMERNVSITKTGVDGSAKMQGVKFDLYRRTAGPGGVFNLADNGARVTTLTIGADNKVTFKLPYNAKDGEYYVVETNTVGNYLLDRETKHELTVAGVIGENIFETKNVATIANVLATKVTVTKYGMTNGNWAAATKLKGAVIALAGGGKTYQTDSMGDASQELSVAPGKYTLTEIDAPTGYSRSTVVKFYVNGALTDIGLDGKYDVSDPSKTYKFDVYNEQLKDLTITKRFVDSNGVSWTPSAAEAAAITLKLVPGSIASNSLTSGQLISLTYDSNGKYVTANRMADSSLPAGEDTEQLQRERFSNEEFFYIIETDNMKGYAFNGITAAGTETATISVDGKDYTGYKILMNGPNIAKIVENKADTGRIRVYKTAIGENYKLTPHYYGGVFYVYDADGVKVAELHTGTEIDRQPSAIYNSGLTDRLPAGTYYIEEVKAPHGLKLQAAEYAKVVSGSLEAVKPYKTGDRIEITVRGNNEISEIVFFNETGEGPGDTAFVNLSIMKRGIVNGTAVLLDGVKFELAMEDPIGTGTYKVVGTLITGTGGAGIATSQVFDKQRNGADDDEVAFHFRLVEKETVNGFVLDPTPRYVTITWGQLTSKIASQDVYTDHTYYGLLNAITNATGKATLEFEKKLTDKDGKAVAITDSNATGLFKDSVFVLYTKDGNPASFTIKNGSAVAVAGVDGGFRPTKKVVEFEVMPGYYYVVEITAPGGYFNTNADAPASVAGMKAVGSFPYGSSIVTGDTNPRITKGNQAIPELSITKKKSDGANVTNAAGAEFEMFTLSNPFNGDSSVFDSLTSVYAGGVITSGANGKVAFDYNLIGGAPKTKAAFAAVGNSVVYYLVETGLTADGQKSMFIVDGQAPVVQVTVTYNVTGNTVSVSYRVWNYTTGAWGDAVTSNATVVNTEKPHIKVVKKDLGMANALTLAPNITFNVYTDAEGADLYTTGKTDANGEVSLYLEPGTYFLKEVDADNRAGFEALPVFFAGSITAFADADKLATVAGDMLQFTIDGRTNETVFTVVNKSTMGQLVLSKAASELYNGMPYYLLGAEFTAKNKTTGVEYPIVIDQTNVDLESYLVTVYGMSGLLPAGEYEITEKTPPTGFAKVDHIFTATVVARQVTSIVRDAENARYLLDTSGIPALAGNNVAIIMNDATWGRLLIEKKDMDGVKIPMDLLKTAEFWITPCDAAGVPTPSAKTLSTKTDAAQFLFFNGEIYSSMLAPGYYLIEEKAAPTGYTLNEDLYEGGADAFKRVVKVEIGVAPSKAATPFKNIELIENMNSGIIKAAKFIRDTGVSADSTEAKNALRDAGAAVQFTIDNLAYKKDDALVNKPFVLAVEDFTVYDGFGTLAGSKTDAHGLKYYPAGSASETDPTDPAAYHITSMKIGATSVKLANGTDGIVKAKVTGVARDASERVLFDGQLDPNDDTFVPAWPDDANSRDDDIIGFKVEYYTGDYNDGGINMIEKGFLPSNIVYVAEFYKTDITTDWYEIGSAINRVVLQYMFIQANGQNDGAKLLVTNGDNANVTFPTMTDPIPTMELTKARIGGGIIKPNGKVSFDIKLTNMSRNDEIAKNIIIVDELPPELAVDNSETIVVKMFKDGVLADVPAALYTFANTGNGTLVWKFDPSITLAKGEYINITLPTYGTVQIVAGRDVVNKARALTYMPIIPSKFFNGEPWKGTQVSGIHTGSVEKYLDLAGVGKNGVANKYLEDEAVVAVEVNDMMAARKFVRFGSDAAFQPMVTNVVRGMDYEYRLMLFGGKSESTINAFTQYRFGDLLPYVNDYEFKDGKVPRSSEWAEAMLPTMKTAPVVYVATSSGNVPFGTEASTVGHSYDIYYCIGFDDNHKDEIVQYLNAPVTSAVLKANLEAECVPGGNWTKDFDNDVKGKPAYGFIVVFDDAYDWRGNVLIADYEMTVPVMPTDGNIDHYLDSLYERAYNSLAYFGWDAETKRYAGADATKVSVVMTPEPARLGDYVWYDEDYDGIQGEDEIPVENVVVNLHKYQVNVEILKALASLDPDNLFTPNLATMTQEQKLAFFSKIEEAIALTSTDVIITPNVKTTMTDADGLYGFDVDPYYFTETSGNVTETISGKKYITLYKVEFVQPAEYSGFTTQGDDLIDEIDSNVDRFGWTKFVFVPGIQGELSEDLSIDAGLVQFGELIVEKDIQLADDSIAPPAGLELDVEYEDGGLGGIDLSSNPWLVAKGDKYVAREFEIALQRIGAGGKLEAKIYVTIDPSMVIPSAIFSGLKYGEYVITEENVAADFRATWSNTFGEIEIGGIKYKTVKIAPLGAGEAVLHVGLTNTVKDGSGEIHVQKRVVEKGELITNWANMTFRIQLQRLVDGAYVFEDEVVLTENYKEHTFANLDTEKDGKGITYRVVEVAGMDGFVVTYSKGIVVLDGNNLTDGVVVTNTVKGGRMLIHKEYSVNGVAINSWNIVFTVTVTNTLRGSEQVVTFTDTDVKTLYLDPGTYVIEEENGEAFNVKYFINGQEANEFEIVAGEEVVIEAVVVNEGSSTTPPTTPPITPRPTPTPSSTPTPSATPTPPPTDEYEDFEEDPSAPLGPITPPPTELEDLDGDTPGGKPNPSTSDSGIIGIIVSGVVLVGVVVICLRMKKKVEEEDVDTEA